MATLDTVTVPNGPALETRSSRTEYNGYNQNHEYEHDTGLIVLPTASRTSGHKVIRLHGGVAMRRVKWHSERDGRPPIIPAAVSTIYDTILHTSVTAALPVPNEQAGSYTFSVKGEYLFVQKAPRVAGTHAFPTAMFPFPIEPMDTIATALAKPVLSNAVSLTAASTDPIGDLSNAVGTAVMGDNPENLWPFTFIPAVFSGTTISG